jgi:hypothetical protein
MTEMTDDRNHGDPDFRRFRIAALLPGLIHAQKVLEAEVRRLQGMLRGEDQAPKVEFVKQERQEAVVSAISALVTGVIADPNATYQKNAWTPERRAAQSERMKEVRAAQPKKESPTPLKIGSMYTLAGIAKQIGLSATGVDYRLKVKGIKAKMVPHPSRPGSLIKVYPHSVIAIARNGQPIGKHSGVKQMLESARVNKPQDGAAA